MLLKPLLLCIRVSLALHTALGGPGPHCTGRLASVHVVRAGAGPGRGASEASEATRSQLCVERRMERGHAG